MVDLCLLLEETRARAASRSTGFGVTHDRRRRLRALRHRGAEAGDARRDRRRQRRGDRHVRARRRLRRGRADHARPSAATAATWSTARRRGSATRTSPTTSCSSAAPTARARKHEGLTMLEVPHEHRRAWRSGRSRRWAARGQRRLLHRLRAADADRLLGEEGGGWMQLMAGLNVERLIIAALIARPGAARVRRPARVRQGARAVRPADRLVPGASSTGSPTSRPRSSAAALLDLRRRAAGRRQPGRDVPARGVDGEAEGHGDRRSAWRSRACR